MFRVAIVQAQDVDSQGNVLTDRVRVTFPDRNQMVSWWLPILRWGSQNDKDFWIPDIGEQVVCLMDEHDEDGAVLGTIFSQVDQAQSGMTADKRNLTVKDSAVFEYDRSKHTLTVTIPANGTVNITVNGSGGTAANINLNVPNGDVTFKTSEHQDSVNKIIDTYNSHVHQFTDSHGDTGPTQMPQQQMP